jgi:hypothetical protein
MFDQSQKWHEPMEEVYTAISSADDLFCQDSGEHFSIVFDRSGKKALG